MNLHMWLDTVWSTVNLSGEQVCCQGTLDKGQGFSTFALVGLWLATAGDEGAYFHALKSGLKLKANVIRTIRRSICGFQYHGTHHLHERVLSLQPEDSLKISSLPISLSGW